jgi:Rps23 Pro-64 3,4-dihydroxylase Tpa1-like proline 4-hydroxylase
MNAESLLDEPYWLNPRVVSSIGGPDSMIVSGIGATFELSFDLFRVLVRFTERMTTRHAFHVLEIDIGIDEFAQIVSDFHDRGLLQRDESADDKYDLRHYLNPLLFGRPEFVSKIGDSIRQGRAVIIPDALPIALAERAYSDLDRASNWRPTEGGHDFFHYKVCVLDSIDDRTPALAECKQLLTSSPTRRFINELSQQDCAGDAGVVATWYRAGEYALPHDDSLDDSRRSIAYIWYVTKDWQREWGGSFFWCPTGQYVVPRFNMLTIFRVQPENVHLVCPVASGATRKRLAVSGFWRRADGSAASPPVEASTAVSHQIYGQCSLPDLELSSIIVL